MNKYWIIILLIVIIEIIVAFIFSLIAQLFYQKIGLDIKSIIKGVMERIFLTIALCNNYPHALTLFSALKLATRLKHDEIKNNEDRFNDYYLIGNLASVTIAIGYVYFYQNFEKFPFLVNLTT